MARFFFRHWTGILIVVAIAGWALLYLPGSPSFAIFQLKRAIDARDGDAAARFVDFESIARNAGNEMLSEHSSGNDFLNQFLGKGAVAVLSGPVAQAARVWAKHQVETGDPDLQMPAGAVAGAILMMHRDGDSAYSKFRDHNGQVWEVHLARNADGQWQLVEVKNIRQILAKLQPAPSSAVEAPR
jgi:hypothetical protein